MRAALALLLLVAAVAAGAFFGGRPGRVEIVWQGWQIETSVGVLVAAAALLAAVVALLAAAVGALRRAPRGLRRHRAARRRRVGETVLTRGLVALAAADAAAASRHAERARRLLGPTPVVLLLAAEAASRQDDIAGAARAYALLAERPDTEFLGLRGLIGQALRGGDDGAALRLAQRARVLRPDARWLVESLVVLQARAGEWEMARDTLASALRRRALPPDVSRHQHAVVLYEMSRAAEHRGELRRAADLAANAQAWASDLAPLAAQNARLLLASGRRRAAARAIERAWRQVPHPELAALYLELRPATAPVARAAALQRLAARNPEAAESHLAIAEAALAAQLWGEARRHLSLAAAAAPPAGLSRRLCLLMARLEESDATDPRAARDWLDRAVGAAPDPAYACARCGAESRDWHALCPVCGAFDTLAWTSPRAAPASIAAYPVLAAAPPILPAAELPPPARVPSRLAPASQSDT